VFPDVQRGLFSDGLYYRLNTVTLLLNRPGRTRHVGEALASTRLQSCTGTNLA
jgi:hypothetical protein